MDDDNETRAMDLVTALEKHGLNLGIRVACDVIQEMHRLAKERRLKALLAAYSGPNPSRNT